MTATRSKLVRYAGNANRSSRGNSFHDTNRAPVPTLVIESAYDEDHCSGQDMVIGCSDMANGTIGTRISSRGRGGPKDILNPILHTITREEYYRRQAQQ